MRSQFGKYIEPISGGTYFNQLPVVLTGIFHGKKKTRRSGLLEKIEIMVCCCLAGDA